MVSYQYLLREMRAKRAIERDLEQREYDRKLALHRLQHPVELKPHWRDTWVGTTFLVIGGVIAFLFQGIVLIFKGIASVMRAQPIQDGSTTKRYKGLVGQIDELERSPFVSTNAVVSKRRRR